MNKRRTRLQAEKKVSVADIGIGLLVTIFLISLGLILAINLRFLYYADIRWFGLEADTNLPYAVIKQNYDALIDYCSPFFRGELVFPTLSASASGISHFAEVKVLFDAFHVLFAVTFITLIVIFIVKAKKGHYRYLLISSITAIVLPCITLAACMINFEAAFTLMHKIFFRNDDWLFDPVTDPIINLLPEQFFLQCAVIIIATVLLGSLVLFLVYRHKTKRNNHEELLPQTKNYIY